MVDHLPNRYFIIHNGQQDLISKALTFSQAINQTLNSGSWLRPMSVEIPCDPEEAKIARVLLDSTGLKYHESPFDLAN